MFERSSSWSSAFELMLSRGSALVVMFVIDRTSRLCSRAVELVLVLECSFFGVFERKVHLL